MLGGNLSPDFSAILKLAGVEGGLDNNTAVSKNHMESNLINGLAETAICEKTQLFQCVRQKVTQQC